MYKKIIKAMTCYQKGRNAVMYQFIHWTTWIVFELLHNVLVVFSMALPFLNCNSFGLHYSSIYSVSNYSSRTCCLPVCHTTAGYNGESNRYDLSFHELTNKWKGQKLNTQLHLWVWWPMILSPFSRSLCPQIWHKQNPELIRKPKAMNLASV